MSERSRERIVIVDWLTWVRIVAGAASLIGSAGLIALLAQNARAETPAPRGFPPGARTFNNPFANKAANAPKGAAPSGGFFEDDEDDADPADSQAATGATPAGAAAGGANAKGNQASAVSMGGNPPGGVISTSQVPNLRIDDETGEGSKEVVTDFNFPDADIMDIAKTLGKLTGKNFILDKDVKGRITIISNSAITVGDAWKAFLTALDINGFALIPSGKYIRIARQRDARDKQLRTYTGEQSPDTDALITRVFPLKYINAEEVARTFRSFMPANSRIIPYEQTNTVIVTDTGSNIAKLNKMLELLDVEGYDAGIEVIPVRYASAVELSKLIDTLLPGTNSTPGAPGMPRFGGGTGGRFNARRTKEGGIINTIIADDRTNNLIVHANTKGADQVRELVAKLDQKVPSPTGGGKVHVRYLQFADAEQIATTLNNLTQGGGARPPTGGPAGGTGTNPIASSLFEGNIKVSADKSTNSLVITASPADNVTIQRVINRLDIPRDEVYVEVVIMEMALNRDFSFSSNIINPSSGLASVPNTDLFKFIGDPTSINGAILGFQSGGSVPLTVAGRTVTVSSVTGLIKVLQTDSKANVLATPQIIALDNSEANFESAEKIPVPRVTTVANGPTQNSVDYQNVALSIKIKPQINKVSNFVKLDVDTKLESIENRVLPAAVQNLAFATDSRTAKTTVVVADGDTVVIGGLTRDNISESVSKIPLLGDIPLLGWLFRAKESSIQKTNLLMFITPHIVRQYEKVRAILDRKLKERDDFLEKNAGGDDQQRDYRDQIIRSLPDIKDVMNQKLESQVTIDEEKPAAVQVNPDGNPFTGGKAEQPPAGTQTPAGTPPPNVTSPQNTPPAQTPPGGEQTAPMAPPPPEAPPGEVPPEVQ